MLIFIMFVVLVMLTAFVMFDGGLGGICDS